MDTLHLPATIPNTEVHMLQTSYIDQEFKISVALPAGYTETNNNYPVLYTLDANIFFGTVVEIIPWLHMAQAMPQTLVVGIGYPTDDFANFLALRLRDQTPTSDVEFDKSTQEQLRPHSVHSGGASHFFKFIRDELIPFVDKEYRTNTTDKTFIGYSSGGLFGLYTLFHHPDTFNRYIIGGPGLWWDNRVTFRYERDFAEKSDTLPARLFLSVGALEEDVDQQMVSNLYQFSAILKNRNYKDLHLEMAVLENETHLSAFGTTFSRGLRSVFKGP